MKRTWLRVVDTAQLSRGVCRTDESPLRSETLNCASQGLGARMAFRGLIHDSFGA